MGIAVEFNPDLALRNMEESRAGKRKIEECIPEPLVPGQLYPFLKKGQRNYWLQGEIPLLRTEGDQKLSLPIASIVIIEATHILMGSEMYTKGTYKVVETFPETEVRFNGFAKL